MAHARKVTRGAEEDIKAQNAGPPKATASASNPAQAVRETTALVKLWRSFPDISVDDAKKFLSKVNFDVQRPPPLFKQDHLSQLETRLPQTAVGLQSQSQLQSNVVQISLEARLEQSPTTTLDLEWPKSVVLELPSRRRRQIYRKHGLPFVHVAIANISRTPHQEMVEITVGTENLQTFTVHKSFICHYSPYFEAAFNNNQSLFVEGKTQRMTVPNIPPDVFGLFVKWVYYKKVTDDNNKPPSNFQLVTLWIQGARFRTPGLQNLALKSLFGKGFCTVAPGFNFLYSNTRPRSALRRLFVDEVICRRMSYLILSDLLKNHWNEMPQEMLQDVILGLKKALRAATTGNRLPELKVEDYLVPEE